MSEMAMTANDNEKRRLHDHDPEQWDMGYAAFCAGSPTEPPHDWTALRQIDWWSGWRRAERRAKDALK